MQCVHAVSVDVARQIRGTSDAADHAYFMRLEAQFEQGALQRRQDREVPAAWTPIGMDAALVSVLGELPGLSRRRWSAGGRWWVGNNAHRIFQTRISWTGTESRRLPANWSFTASTMLCGMNGS